MKRFSRSFLFLCCVALIAGAGVRFVLFLTQEQGTQGRYLYTEEVLGTVLSLTLVAQDEKTADKAFEKVLATIRSYGKDFDHRQPEGSIGRINKGAGKYWVTPSPKAFRLIQAAWTFSKKTEGVFDPTIGSLTTIPLYYTLDDKTMAEKKRLVDYSNIEFNEKKKKIRLKKQGMALDMGGIAKGTIIDACVAQLRAFEGIQGGVVDIGGDMYCFGEYDWHIGIAHPREKQHAGKLLVREKAVCGSGDYERFVLLDFITRRHHLIDPEKMQPADKSTGVIVIAGSTQTADVLATTLFILGPQKGQQLVQKHWPQAEALWFTPERSSVATPDFNGQ